MRCAIYARVSTQDQSTVMQVMALRDYVSRRGWDLADEFVDTGISGSKERRPALDRLMADARRPAFDAVAVFRFDRFDGRCRALPGRWTSFARSESNS